ncbi:MAG: ECF transporter S component [Firmicutes bacterium]|nr:ECF transporter S component [Bacillota bacterium]
MKINFLEISQTKRAVFCAVFVAFGVLLPFVTAHAYGPPTPGVPSAGQIFLPMHLPVLLCGLLLGPLYGLACGVLSPVLSSLTTGMPVPYPMLPIMIVELAIYGAASGLLHKKFKLPLPISLPLTLVLGRVGYGLAWLVLLGLNSAGITQTNRVAPTVFAAIATGAPGVAIQLVLIPLLLNAVELSRKGVRAGGGVLSGSGDLVLSGSALNGSGEPVGENTRMTKDGDEISDSEIVK